MKHTKGPWQVTGNGEVYGFTIVDTNNEEIAYVEIEENIRTATEAKEIAEFIVKACNSHYDLLEACRYASGNLSPKGNIKKDFSGHLAMATLSKEIHKAEDNQ